LVSISGPTAAGPIGTARAAQRTRGPSGFQMTEEASSAKGALAPSNVGNLASVGALLAMQEEDGPPARRRRMVRRAHGLLDQLDRIKLALLEGEMPHERLNALVVSLQEQREEVEDENLAALLEQVEIRAEVERAKLEMAQKRSTSI